MGQEPDGCGVPLVCVAAAKVPVSCASRWVLMCAATVLCTCIGVHVFLWKRWSFLAFQMYHSVIRIFFGIRGQTLSWRWTFVELVGLHHFLVANYQSARRDWKRTKPLLGDCNVRGDEHHLPLEQCLSMWEEYLAARSAEASAHLISLHVKALRRGGRSLDFHARCRIRLLIWTRKGLWSIFRWEAWETRFGDEDDVHGPTTAFQATP
jgi:hypothetical protein